MNSHRNPMSGVKQETRFIVKMANAFKGFNWARYYTGDGQHLEISVKPEVKKQYRAQKVALWRCFVPRQVGVSCNSKVHEMCELKIEERR